MSEDHGWIFDDKILNDEDIPENAIAFLYKITNKETGIWYIGRKNLYKKVVKVVKGKKKKSLAPSDWKDYWSSSDFLKSLVERDGKEMYVREILIFVETASATIYGEEALLYMTGGMFDPLCVNGHIRTKIMRKWFENKESDLHDRLMSLKLFRLEL